MIIRIHAKLPDPCETKNHAALFKYNAPFLAMSPERLPDTFHSICWLNHILIIFLREVPVYYFILIINI